jgi:chemotaxis protein CheD
MTETMVRMGELAASAKQGHALVALGLGSCIGLGLIDRGRGVVGLAHVVLPSAEGRPGDNPLKFADVAVPELLTRVVALGARRPRLEAVLVGGASMFATQAATLDVGGRNDAAVRDQLRALRIPVRAAATGGSRGRTVRLEVSGPVRVREAGGKDVELLAAPEGVR